MERMITLIRKGAAAGLFGDSIAWMVQAGMLSVPLYAVFCI